MSIIIETVQQYLPAKRKQTTGGWISFNCVACTHEGHRADTRGRAGVIISADGISYSCFNCSFKASWKVGRRLTKKFKTLLTLLNVPSDKIKKCALDALRYVDDDTIQSYSISTFFNDKDLPPNSSKIKDFINDPPVHMLPVLEYIYDRGLDIDDYEWYFSNNLLYKNRLIIPFFYYNRIVGYTARIIKEDGPKYITSNQNGYVFNIDKQTDSRKFVILCEGPLDAICIDGIAVLGNKVNQSQRTLIDQLNKEVIVVPDKHESGYNLVEQALEFGWNVSFPSWDDNINDINDSVIRYGKLYTLWDILQNKKHTPLSIKRFARDWFN